MTTGRQTFFNVVVSIGIVFTGPLRSASSQTFSPSDDRSIDADLKQILAPARTFSPQKLPLLGYRRVPVTYNAETDSEESNAMRVRFAWIAAGEAARFANGSIRVYLLPDSQPAPFVFMFPISGDPDFRYSKEICRYYVQHGLRCAYLERALPQGSEIPKELDQIFELPGLPPHSVETARRGLDALEEMGVLRPGEKIGAGGISLGGVDAALLALTDPRAAAAAIVISGGDLPKILSHIHGAAVSNYKNARTEQMRAHHWNLKAFEDAMAQKTDVADPIAYAKAIPEQERLPLERFLMISVKGDPAVPNECSCELFRALGAARCEKPNYEVLRPPFPGLNLLIPKDYRHVSAILRIHHIEARMVEHFKKWLVAE